MKYTSLCAMTLVLGTLLIGCSNDDTPPATVAAVTPAAVKEKHVEPSLDVITKVAAIEPTQKSAPQTAAIASPDQSKLAKSSGCFACHAINDKIIGPAWKDVADHYRDDSSAKVKLLAKVKKGGGGNWTSVTGGLPMPPYSPRVSDRNLELLVDFVLSLK